MSNDSCKLKENAMRLNEVIALEAVDRSSNKIGLFSRESYIKWESEKSRLTEEYDTPWIKLNDLKIKPKH